MCARLVWERDTRGHLSSNPRHVASGKLFRLTWIVVIAITVTNARGGQLVERTAWLTVLRFQVMPAGLWIWPM